MRDRITLTTPLPISISAISCLLLPSNPETRLPAHSRFDGGEPLLILDLKVEGWVTPHAMLVAKRCLEFLNNILTTVLCYSLTDWWREFQVMVRGTRRSLPRLISPLSAWRDAWKLGSVSSHCPYSILFFIDIWKPCWMFQFVHYVSLHGVKDISESKLRRVGRT